MQEMRQRERLEFDSAPPRFSDVRLSEPFKTVGGDQIRALFTTTGRMILTPVGDTSSVLNSVVVTTTDDVDVLEFAWGEFLGDVWDGIKTAATAVSDVLAESGKKGGDKGGGDCNGQVVVNGDHNIVNVQVGAGSTIHQQ